jgi:hypothetical protein
MSSIVTKLRIITAHGQPLDIDLCKVNFKSDSDIDLDSSNPDDDMPIDPFEIRLAKAAGISVGLLGVLSEITLQIEPLHDLYLQFDFQHVSKFKETWERLWKHRDQYNHLEAQYYVMADLIIFTTYSKHPPAELISPNSEPPLPSTPQTKSSSSISWLWFLSLFQKWRPHTHRQILYQSRLRHITFLSRIAATCLVNAVKLAAYLSPPSLTHLLKRLVYNIYTSPFFYPCHPSRSHITTFKIPQPHALAANEGAPKHEEIELSVSVDSVAEVMGALETFYKTRVKMHEWPLFPVDIRPIRKEPFYLSQAYERDCVTIDLLYTVNRKESVLLPLGLNDTVTSEGMLKRKRENRGLLGWIWDWWWAMLGSKGFCEEKATIQAAQVIRNVIKQRNGVTATTASTTTTTTTTKKFLTGNSTDWVGVHWGKGGVDKIGLREEMDEGFKKGLREFAKVRRVMDPHNMFLAGEIKGYVS